MIVIVDFKLGNIRSIKSKLKKFGIKSIISSKIEDLERAEKIILPGVGHFSEAMKNLRDLNIIDILNYKVLEKKTPILGICLGFQLMTKHSDEGDCKGLNWVDLETKKFIFKKSSLRVPHVGWNTVSHIKESLLFSEIPDNYRFYFTHSYHVSGKSDKFPISITNYGKDFISAIHYKNIFGTQFHPEKSHYDGFKIISNFLKYS